MDQDQLRRRLYWTINEYFNESELRDLCFDLGLDYDNLGDDGKSDRARELVSHYWRRGALMTLLQRVEALRPKGRYGEYFRQLLRDSIFTTQEIDVKELRRMSNTGPMGIDLKAFLALNDKVDRLVLVAYISGAVIVLQVLIIILLLVMR